MIAPDFTEAFRAAHPGSAIGLLAMTSVRNATTGNELDARIGAIEASVRERYAGQSRSDLERSAALRPYLGHYRRFGKTYHVLLQLESVAFRGRPLSTAGPLVSAMFAAEIDNLLLTAAHDLDALRPPLVADVTKPGERYTGISGKAIEVRAGDMSLRDHEGIISTVLYGPDLRTRLLPETTSVLFTTYAPAGILHSRIEDHLRDIEGLVLAGSPRAVTEAIAIASVGER